MTKRKLTDKQKLFAEYYAETLNATQAARLAKYRGSDETLWSTGSDNIRKPKVRAYIDELLDAKKLSPEEVIFRLSEHAKIDMADYLEVGELEGFNTIDLAKARKAGKLRFIKSVRVTKSLNGGSVSIDLYDAQAALDKLAKYHGLYQERVDLTTGGEPFDLEAWDKTRAKRKADVEAMDDETES